MIRVGTRDSALAVWQANCVMNAFQKHGVAAQLVYIKSDGDKDTLTPLYAMGVEGIFTKALDVALLNGKIDVAVHSMKDVPIQLAAGLRQAAVLERGNHLDVFVPKNEVTFLNDLDSVATVATCSIRRMAQWLRRYPNHSFESIRGNVDLRLQKLYNSKWHGAIFAAAGLERIGLRPETAVDLDWMLPAPAQGAIMVVCRKEDDATINACAPLNHEPTSICVTIERDFLKRLMGGCSAPISALATFQDNVIQFRGNILSVDGKQMVDMELCITKDAYKDAGVKFAEKLIAKGADELIQQMRGGNNV
jgi:hydroxymethylbilane synthase